MASSYFCTIQRRVLYLFRALDYSIQPEAWLCCYMHPKKNGFNAESFVIAFATSQMTLSSLAFMTNNSHSLFSLIVKGVLNAFLRNPFWSKLIGVIITRDQTSQAYEAGLAGLLEISTVCHVPGSSPIPLMPSIIMTDDAASLRNAARVVFRVLLDCFVYSTFYKQFGAFCIVLKVKYHWSSGLM